MDTSDVVIGPLATWVSLL